MQVVKPWPQASQRRRWKFGRGNMSIQAEEVVVEGLVKRYSCAIIRMVNSGRPAKSRVWQLAGSGNAWDKWT
jgi:hypothetical protein